MKKLPGSSILYSARDWNRAQSAADVAQVQTFVPQLQSGSHVVDIENNTGADRNEFEILAIDSVSITPTDDADVFKYNTVLKSKATAPAEADFSRIAITQEPIESGKVGKAIVFGVTAVQLNVRNTAHRFADVFNATSGYTKLDTADAGSAKILYQESGTGTKWATVCLGVPVTVMAGTLDGILNVGSNQTIESSFTNVHDFMMATGESIASGAEVIAVWLEGEWKVIGANTCPA